MLELLENAQASVDELMNEAARAFIEQLLALSAQEVAGAKRRGSADGQVLSAWQPARPDHAGRAAAAGHHRGCAPRVRHRRR
jgi:hypothetical protein